jgi:hypothetical protein
MTNQVMLMMAMEMTKMDTTVNVRRRTKSMSEDPVGIFLAGGCSMFITLDFGNKVCALILLVNSDMMLAIVASNQVLFWSSIGIAICYEGEGDAVIKS